MRLKLVLSVSIALILYLGGPLIAGLLGIGERDGPRIYPSDYHSALYMIAYEEVRGEKPRLNIDQDQNLERPLFYGFPRTRRRS
jgi:hypothetical protein